MHKPANNENSIPASKPRPFTPLQSRPPLRFLQKSPNTSFSYPQDPPPLHSLIPEIFSSLIQQEQPSPDYMSLQSEINYKMRAILIDWLVSVHLQFKLQNETLFLCVNLIDRYLTVRNIEKKYLQLVGVCALMVACKYEEIYPPRLKDFLFVTEKAYSEQEMIRMERDLLKAVGFCVNVPTGLMFVERWGVMLGMSEKSKYLAKYLCELALVEYFMSKFRPSLVALAAVYVAGKVGKEGVRGVGKVAGVVKVSEGEMKACARELVVLLGNAQNHVLCCVKDKYASERFGQVSKISI